MSLTQEDLQQIEAVLDRRLNPVLGELTTPREDIKEIYDMITKLQSGAISDVGFSKKSLEEELLTLNAELLAAAKQAGIILPRG
ncbi:MAG TPA: hypothetical protein VLF69_05380 [Candidatus Saccharimonadales bacterium]|nr:hypothetical protein [Candidatus Saccharimonadales bacterium]